MTRSLPVVLALICALVLPAAAAAAPSVQDRYIVVLKDSADSATVAAEHGRRYDVQDRIVYGNAIQGYAGRIPPGRVSDVASDPRVEYIEPDGIAYATTTQAGATWGLDRIDQRLATPLSGSFTYLNTGA